jgi:hypothetical protein
MSESPVNNVRIALPSGNERSPVDEYEYLQRNVPTIEAAFSTVVNKVLAKRPNDPLLEISKQLYEEYGWVRAPRKDGISKATPMNVSSGLMEEVAATEKKTVVRKLDESSEPVFTCSRDLAVGEVLPAMIAATTSTQPGGSRGATGQAMREAARELYAELGGTADLVLCFCTEQHRCTDVESVARELFKAVPFAASTSHGGLVTQLGAVRVGAADCPAALALWAIRDAAGAFTVASAPVSAGDGYAHAGAAAAAKARASIGELIPSTPGLDGPPTEGGRADVEDKDSESGRRHEELLWLLTAPGNEELVMGGLRAELPPRSVILGSSSGDESLKARWWHLAISPASPAASGCFGDSAVPPPPVEGCGERPSPTPGHAAEGVVIVHFRPSLDFTPVYSHGYSPTVHRALVVANGVTTTGQSDLRVLKSLGVRGRGTDTERDPEPAAVVYNRWTGGHFEAELEAARNAKEGGEPVNILLRSSEFPLGVKGAHIAAETSEIGRFTCSSAVMLHPAFIHRDLSLSVFVNTPVGTEVQLLCGTSDTIVHRIAEFGEALDERAPFSRESVLGSLVFFCGGVMDCVAQSHDQDRIKAAFAKSTVNKPFVAVHPFGEQCFQSAWERPMHANLMFGGVVFGKAAYGLARRAEIFISYHWGKELRAATSTRQEVLGFQTQAIVSQLKAELERNTRLTCWFDLDRMGAGVDILVAMWEGVTRADVFCCCLTDDYMGSVNCMRELKHAVEADKLIIPLLLAGYADSELNRPPWPPPEATDFVRRELDLSKDFIRSALPASRLFVDLRTPEKQRANFPSLVNRIDSQVRSLRGARHRRHLHAAVAAATIHHRQAIGKKVVDADRQPSLP